MLGQLLPRLCVLYGFSIIIQGLKARSWETPPRIVHHPSDVVVKVHSPATLSCRAEGFPEPTIEWYRNGLPVETDKQDGQSQPVVLPEGSLFFLSLVPGRRGQSQEGVYTCVARNSAGKAVSRNASLHIAALRDEFLSQPSNVDVAVGDMAVLNCTPPIGHPEPNVTWKKDGILLSDMDERFTVYNGKLVIAPAYKNDTGVYVCVASNSVGVRESRGARLSVLAKPVFLRKPEDITVNIGDVAQFFCQVQGDPLPSVKWNRDQSSLPSGRYIVNQDQSLQVHYVTAQDAGRYTCTAVNDVGESSATAFLAVQQAVSPGERDLHRELSALRVDLEDVSVLPPASSLLQLHWRLQPSWPQLHHLEGFEVLFRSLLPASSEWLAKRVPLPHLQAVVGPLKRGYKYEFKVRPYSSDLYGRESNTKHLRVPELVPSSPPGGVAVTMALDRNNTIRISWDPPPQESHNGIIQGYQVWCVQPEGQKSLNWTVNSATHSLEITTFEPGKQYWVRVAAVNGAGVGVQSDPKQLTIEPQRSLIPHRNDSDVLTRALALVRDPVFIGGIGALLWCILMVTVVCLYRRHTRPTHLRARHRKSAGLYRLATEDLIIKHRMAAPDSPWMPGIWKSPQNTEQYHSLWVQSKDSPSFQKATLPVTEKKDPIPLDTAVPVVSDSCGVYGTFYVDLTSNGLKTFNSPAQRPKVAHQGPQAPETAGLSQPVLKIPITQESQPLPWKHALPIQPRMGVLKESREKGHKRELHAVNSAPLVPIRQQSMALQTSPKAHLQRFSHHTPGGLLEGSSRLLHYSASVHLIDMLPPATQSPLDETRSLSSEEGSSRSTKLTEDSASVLSMCPAPPASTAASDCLSFSNRPYSRLSTASFCMSVDDHQDMALAAQEVSQYLELSPKIERRRILSESPVSLPRPFTPTPTFGYICGPLMSDLDTEDTHEDTGRSHHPVARRVALRSTPSSCCSEWEDSLWNGWGSVTDSNVPSARTSIISSSDGSFMTDTNFARVLAAAAESMGGTSLSEFSPSASPLSSFFPTRECFGDLDPLPVWNWSTAWMEEMEAHLRASRTAPASPAPIFMPDTLGHRQDDRMGAVFLDGQSINKMHSRR
nr:roundabout homolog 4 isoform X1 [Paramormyrops kingsleyae]